MDKKTLLAFGLSFLVFLVWSILFSPKPSYRPADKQPGFKNEPSPPVLKERPIPSDLRRDLALDAVKDIQGIIVETDLYKVILSGTGPFIKSFKLKKYKSSLDEHSPLKELIQVKNKEVYGFDLGFSGELLPNIQWTAYEAYGKNINIKSGDQPKELAYTWKSPEGVDIQTKLIFYADTYKIDLSVYIDNRSIYTINDNLSLNLTCFPKGSNRGYGAFEGMALFLGNKLKEVRAEKLKEEQFSGRIDWVAYEEPYFMNTIINKNINQATVKSAILLGLKAG